jgi:hypothetical protein
LELSSTTKRVFSDAGIAAISLVFKKIKSAASNTIEVFLASLLAQIGHFLPRLGPLARAVFFEFRKQFGDAAVKKLVGGNYEIFFD